MKSSKNHKPRRSFLKNAALGSAAITAAPVVLAASSSQKILLKPRRYDDYAYAANDQVNISLIGSGIRGILDMRFALAVPGVKLVAVCDLYDGRLDRAKELWRKTFSPPATTGKC